MFLEQLIVRDLCRHAGLEGVRVQTTMYFLMEESNNHSSESVSKALHVGHFGIESKLNLIERTFLFEKNDVFHEKN